MRKTHQIAAERDRDGNVFRDVPLPPSAPDKELGRETDANRDQETDL